MDPNANLAQHDDTWGDELETLREALAAWLKSGGFDPDWTKYPNAAEQFFVWWMSKGEPIIAIFNADDTIWWQSIAPGLWKADDGILRVQLSTGGSVSYLNVGVKSVLRAIADAV